MKTKLILLIFVLFNLSYLETNAICTRSDFNDNESYSNYLSGDAKCDGKGIYDNVINDSEELSQGYDGYNNKKENLAKQEEILNQIEEATRGEGAYADSSNETRQEMINALYKEYEKTGGDANGWVGGNNLEEARQDLEDRKLELVKQKKELGQNSDDIASNAGQISKNVDNAKSEINNNKAYISHNEEATNQIQNNIDSLEKKYNDLNVNAANLEDEANNAVLKAKFAQNSANTSEQISKELENNYNNSKEEYERAVNEGGYSVEELNSLKTKMNNNKTELEKKDYLCGGEACNAKDFAKSEKEDAEFEAEWAASEVEDAAEANKKVEKSKEDLEKLKKRKEEANKALEVCEKDPENCKKVYSEQQKKERTKEIIAEKSAQKNIEKEIDNVDKECSKGDTVACREAIVKMNKAETKKACLQPNSETCKAAKNNEKTSNEVTDEAKKSKKSKEDEIDKDIKKESENADKVCTSGTLLECQEAIAKQVEAETQKACVEPSSKSCSEAKENSAAVEAMVNATKENISNNSGLKTLGSSSTMDALLGITGKTSIIDGDNNTEEGGFTTLSKLTIWFKDSLTGLVQLLAVGAFLFVGIRLAIARGNPEEFKKALQQMIYVIVGIFVISISWAAVVLVAGISI